MTQYIFLYGTLLPGHAPSQIAAVVGRLRRVGRGQARGRLYDFGRYPGAVLSKAGPPIYGEVFELPDDPEVLRQLDAYEEFDPARPGASEFIRKKWQIVLQDGKKLSCWVYAYNRGLGSACLIRGGNFTAFRKS